MTIDSVAEAVAGSTERVFAVPGGGRSLELIDLLAGHAVEVVTPHHEASAAVMAATLGRLTGRAGVAISIKGPGLANLLPGLAFASLEAWPVVALSEAYAADAPSWRAHKRMAHAELTRAVAKRHARCVDGASYRAAHRLASTETPGVVALDLLPGDEHRVEADAGSAPRGPDGVTLLRVLEASQRPLVVAGTLARRRGWGESLARLDVPVMTTAAAKGAVPERLTQVAGVYTGAGGPRSPEAALVAEADLIVGIGLRDRELLGPVTHAVEVVVIDDHPDLASDPAITARAGERALPSVLDLLGQRSWGVELAAAATGRLREELTSGPFLPGPVLAAAGQVFGPEARLVVDTGDFCTIAEHVWQTDHPDAYLGAGQSRYMGVGVSVALAAALHDPTIPTLLAVGDGGIGPAFGELTLAVERSLPLAVLFMRDGALASIKGRALRDGLSTLPLERGSASWRDAAAGLGFEVATATSVATCEDVLSTWEPQQGPLFLECSFDPDLYLAMTQGLR